MGNEVSNFCNCKDNEAQKSKTEYTIVNLTLIKRIIIIQTTLNLMIKN